ncbi:hypothetical protein BaRGS_00014174 [Batillaria attramentaria]|uniref:Uncharacterized protein n=1 Tax=Batillaria attramentaria TaxID=370345 RepID=A0ABD0L5E6_9CAEN
MSSTALPPGPEYILRGSCSPVTAVHFTESCLDGLLSGTLDGKLLVWDLKTRRIQHTLDAHNGHHVLSILTVPESMGIVTVGREGFLKLWHPTESSYELTSK